MKRLLLASIAALSVLSASAAHAVQRTHVEAGKPKIVTRIIHIRGSLLPPPKYDKPYEGELEIKYSDDIEHACPNVHSDTACASSTLDHKKCFIFMLTEDALKRKGNSYNFTLRHELAHCNGWRHPNTTDGRKFKVGEKWDEAEGGKWVAADTKVPMPKLPMSTKILPASPPTICVTPDWKEEACSDRKPYCRGVGCDIAKVPTLPTFTARPSPAIPIVKHDRSALYRTCIVGCACTPMPAPEPYINDCQAGLR